VTDQISFSAQALDYESGNLSSAISWSSSKDGALGTGAQLTQTLSPGTHAITASVTDPNNNTTTATHVLSVVANAIPVISISTPVENSTVAVGATVTLAATATDLENGNLSNAISWSSNKDGNLGTGSSVTVTTLSPGLHVLTASATDSENATGTARKSIQVGPPVPVAQYSHNALGQRVIKTNTATNQTLHFIYDPEGRVIAEIDAATGVTQREYLYVDGQQVAVVDATGSANEAIYYVHTDHLTTPQKITNDSQTVVWAADYEPFGKTSISTSTISSNTRFPGQYADEESGLHYNYFRDYDPGTGRYIESDPIGLQGGPNTYAYVHNRPLSNVDFLGLYTSAKWTSGPSLSHVSGEIVGDIGFGEYWTLIPPSIGFAGKWWMISARITGVVECINEEVCDESRSDVFNVNVELGKRVGVGCGITLFPMIRKARGAIKSSGSIVDAINLYRNEWAQQAIDMAKDPMSWCLLMSLANPGK
jgi:RHS repeat-associated protein